MTTNVPPRALRHQELIVQAIVKTFELDITVLEAMQRGGARTLEKLIRSYHYWATEYNEGICPYDHPKLGYFRMSKKAAGYDGPAKGLHCEHVVPVRWIVAELVRRRKISAPTQAEVEGLMKLNEIVVLLKEEARLIDKVNRSTMPTEWKPEHGHLVRLTNHLQLAANDLVGDRLVGPE